jgi:hypothetical protein
MSRMTRRERILAAGAILFAASAAAASVMDLTAIAAYAAGVAALLVSIDFVYRRAARPHPMRSQVEKFVHSGRKLVIYERDTGLFAHWYVDLRGNEECDRARRYGRALSVIVIEPSRGVPGEEWATQQALCNWLGRELRQSDIAGYLGNGRCVVIMPEADGAAVGHVIRRLKNEGYATDIGLAVYPGDGDTYDVLYRTAAAQLPVSLRHIA